MSNDTHKKTIFVTVGTTQFDELIQTVLSAEILETLAAKGYNHLILQIGNSSMMIDCTPRYGFKYIEFFHLSSSIAEYIKTSDFIISHAGAGSVLEALEMGKHLLVVINDRLMNNHQTELAEQLYIDQHLYYCTCETFLNVIRTMDLTKLKLFNNEKSQLIANFIDNVMGFT